MRFVIATLPDVKFSLGRDLTLVKACALYGDESVLFSPTYAGTKPLLDFSRRPLLHQLVYLALLKSDPGFVVGEKLTHSERTARIRRAKEDGERFRSMASTVLRLLSETGSTEDAQRQLDEIVAEVRPHSQKVESVWSEETDLVRRARELARAQSMGFVTIENIHDVPSLFFNPDNLRTNVVAELDRPEAYGALDERFLKEFSGLSDAPAQKMGVALVATQVLAGLPSFADATFEEIRDARAELAPHLASFRKAIVDISGGIRSTPGIVTSRMRWNWSSSHACTLQSRRLRSVFAKTHISKRLSLELPRIRWYCPLLLLSGCYYLARRSFQRSSDKSPADSRELVSSRLRHTNRGRMRAAKRQETSSFFTIALLSCLRSSHKSRRPSSWCEPALFVQTAAVSGFSTNGITVAR